MKQTTAFGTGQLHQLNKIVSLALLTALWFALPTLTGEARAACDLSPEGKVLVVSNNVYEAESSDAADPRDMKRFVGRMQEMVPTAPDIVLVQEVRRSAVNNIRSYLESRFGCRFSIAANASASGWRWVNNHRIIGQDTAVIFNADSMNVLAKGHIANDYELSQAASGEPVKVKKAAWAKLREKDLVVGQGPELLTLAAASVHYPRATQFSTKAVAEALDTRFSKNIADRLESKLAEGNNQDSNIHVIAGDFNMSRFDDAPRNERGPYRLLTHTPYNYKDGVIKLAATGSPNPIDFLFSTGNAVRAELDKYNTHDESAPDFYSNHNLRWAMLEGPDTTSPTVPGDIERNQGYDSWTRVWGWDHSHDGGSGFAGYTVYRRHPQDISWDVIKRNLMDNDYRDESVADGAVYEYQITALDGAGNESQPNATIQIKAGN